MEKLSGKQSGERKDGYGNILYPGEYYSKRHDSYEYRYKGSNGKIQTKGAKTLELLRDAEDKIACDLLGDYSGYRTVERLINMYLDAKNNIDKVTLTGYWNNYKLHVKGSWFGKLEIKQVDESKVLEFYNELVTVAGLKKSTVALINDFVNPSFATAVNYHWIENNPCKTCMKNIQNTKSSTIEILTLALINDFINPAFRLAVDCHWIIDNPCRACLRDVKNTEVKKNEVLTLKQQNSLCQFTQMFYPRFYPILKCCLEMGFRFNKSNICEELVNTRSFENTQKTAYFFALMVQ